MKSLKHIFGFGLLVWVIPFVIAFVLFPIRSDDRIFFESIMPVVLVITTAVLAWLCRKRQILRSWQTGLLWLVLSVLFDQLFFTWGPQKISFMDYWKDIGFVYLLIPVITWAVHSNVTDVPASAVVSSTSNAGLGTEETGVRASPVITDHE